MLTGLFVLEFAKILVTVSLLVAAPLVLASPDWIAIVVSFVLTLKVYWVVALIGLRQARHVQKIGINE
jgi:ATP synthase protein I